MSARASRCRRSGHGAIEALLAANEGTPAREQLTLIRIFEALRGLGYDGNCDAVRRYAKARRKQRGAATAEAYVPLSLAPGEADQFDWSLAAASSLSRGTDTGVDCAGSCDTSLAHWDVKLVRGNSSLPAQRNMRSFMDLKVGKYRMNHNQSDINERQE